MNKQQKQQSTTLRLSKLDRRMPTLELIGQCLAEAQKNPGRNIEQPFAVGKPVYTYSLACTFDPTQHTAEANWTLFQGEGQYRESLWTYQTGDPALILNLLLKECQPGDEIKPAGQMTTIGPTAATAAISLTRLQAVNLKDADIIKGEEKPQEPIGYFKKPTEHKLEAVRPGAPTPPTGSLMPQIHQAMPAFQQATPAPAPYGTLPQQNAAQAPPAPYQPPKAPSSTGEIGTISGSRPPISAWGTTPQPGLLSQPPAAPEPSASAQAKPEIKMSYSAEPPPTLQLKAVGKDGRGEPLDYQSETVPHYFMNPPPYTRRPPTLDGDLTDMTPPSLLQSMQIGKMTGVLMVISHEDMVEIYFEEGLPIHAIAPDSKGEAAVMELLMWDVGKFAFYPNERTTERTVRRRMEGMLMESAPLMDQYRYLAEVGLSMNSYVVRRQGMISESEFEQRVQRGARMDMEKQKQFYQLIDNKSTLFDLLRKMPMPKVEWIPTLYNLICCDLAAPSGNAQIEQAIPPLEAMGIDRAPIEAALKALKRPATGLIDYPVILHNLEQEFFRYEHTATPFCILLFDMRYRSKTGLDLLPPVAVQEAAKRIATVKRNIDCLAHFEQAGFILVLPSTQVSAATLVAKRLCDILWDSSLGGNLDSRSLALAFGVAGMPEDCQDLGSLLNSARESLNQSKRTGSPVVGTKKNN